MKDRLKLIVVIALVSVFCAGNVYAGLFATTDKLQPLGHREVKVAGEIGRRIDITVENHLLKIDLEKDFLEPFREKNKGAGFIGIGMLTDSIVRFAAYTGDQRVIQMKKQVVDLLVDSQEEDGYIGMVKPKNRMWMPWDLHEMSYIVIGLTSDYEFFGEEKSLAAAAKAMDYMIDILEAQPRLFYAEPNNFYTKVGKARMPWGLRRCIELRTTGFARGQLGLYEATGNNKYLDFCTDFQLEDWKLPDWRMPIVKDRYGRVEAHAYVYIGRCLAQLKLNRIKPDNKLFRQTHDVLNFLTKDDGLSIHGSVGGIWESFGNDQEGRDKLTETCTTAYFLWLLDNMLRYEVNSDYGDIMERAIYNALFAAQSPDGRKLRYYTPFEGRRKWFEMDSYCCPGNFRRIIADLPTLIYYRSGNGLLVNLYTESVAKTELANGVILKLKQETDYPNTGKVTFTLLPSKEAKFPIKLRIPRWCKGATVSVNGKPAKGTVKSGSFFTINRKWKIGDQITLDMPMEFRFVKGRKRQMTRVAVMRGPQLFCMNPDHSDQDQAFSDMDGADLGHTTFVHQTLEGPFEDDSARPGGMACKMRAYKQGENTGFPSRVGALPDHEVILTEFADPCGTAAYFRLLTPEYKIAVHDELVEVKPQWDW